MPVLLFVFSATLQAQGSSYYRVIVRDNCYDCIVTGERQAAMNIKTNLVLDAMYVHGYGMAPAPNGQIEFYPRHGHWTPVLSFDCPWWTYEAKDHKYFQIRNYQVEARYYFRKQDARYDGFYLGAYAHAMLYGVGFNAEKGYQGEGIGAGLSLGYVLPFSKNRRSFASHWKVEFGLQVGWFGTLYDSYRYGCPVEEPNLYYKDLIESKFNVFGRHQVWNWGGPTRVGISLSYDLLYYKENSKAWSFRWRDNSRNKRGKKGGAAWIE